MEIAVGAEVTLKAIALRSTCLARADSIVAVKVKCAYSKLRVRSERNLDRLVKYVGGEHDVRDLSQVQRLDVLNCNCIVVDIVNIC